MLRFERMRFLGVVEYPAWFKPKARKSRWDNEHRFRDECESVDEILAPIGLTLKSPRERISNPFLQWYVHLRRFERDEVRELCEEALAAGFEGALGLLLGMAYGNPKTQIKYARLAASAGLDEYVLWAALSQDRSVRTYPVGEREDADKLAHIERLCGVVAKTAGRMFESCRGHFSNRSEYRLNTGTSAV